MSVTIYENLLDELLLEQCYAYSIDQYDLKSFQVENKIHWDQDLVNDSQSIYSHFMPTSCDLYPLISETIFEKTGQVASIIIFYYAMPQSHICWHNDADYDSAISIYLNRNWSPNYGGLFLYKMDKKLHAVLPTINTAVLQKDGVWHGTSATTIDSPIRLSIQIFCKQKQDVHVQRFLIFSNKEKERERLPSPPPNLFK
jgi:hypothetical protein